jgi:hypothetical protein
MTSSSCITEVFVESLLYRMCAPVSPRGWPGVCDSSRDLADGVFHVFRAQGHANMIFSHCQACRC